MDAPCFSDKLNTAINGSCSDQVVGVENEGVIVARSFINKATMAFVAGSLVVDTFALAGADKGYKITQNGDMPFKATKVEGTRGDFIFKFDSTVGFTIHGNSPAISKQVVQLANEQYYLILQNKSYSAADKNKYMLLAPLKGLSMSKASFAMETQDAYGWAVEMMEKESLIPMGFIWKTDEATTDAIIAAIIA